VVWVYYSKYHSKALNKISNVSLLLTDPPKKPLLKLVFCHFRSFFFQFREQNGTNCKNKLLIFSVYLPKLFYFVSRRGNIYYLMFGLRFTWTGWRGTCRCCCRLCHNTCCSYRSRASWRWSSIHNRQEHAYTLSFSNHFQANQHISRCLKWRSMIRQMW